MGGDMKHADKGVGGWEEADWDLNADRDGGDSLIVYEEERQDGG